MTSTPQEIADECNSFLRTYILGPSPPGKVRGIRRQRPLEGVLAENYPEGNESELPDEQPMPELDGLEVEIGDGDEKENGVVLDIIPLENATALVDSEGNGSTIRITFIFCTNYPSHLINPEDDKYEGKRIVVFPQDPRFRLWVAQCLDILYHHLGCDASSVNFDVELFADRYENLVKDELTLPENS
jgi:hypothetical protein